MKNDNNEHLLHGILWWNGVLVLCSKTLLWTAVCSRTQIMYPNQTGWYYVYFILNVQHVANGNRFSSYKFNEKSTKLLVDMWCSKNVIRMSNFIFQAKTKFSRFLKFAIIFDANKKWWQKLGKNLIIHLWIDTFLILLGQGCCLTSNIARIKCKKTYLFHLPGDNSSIIAADTLMKIASDITMFKMFILMWAIASDFVHNHTVVLVVHWKWKILLKIN